MCVDGDSLAATGEVYLYYTFNDLPIQSNLTDTFADVISNPSGLDLSAFIVYHQSPDIDRDQVSIQDIRSMQINDTYSGVFSQNFEVFSDTFDIGLPDSGLDVVMGFQIYIMSHTCYIAFEWERDAGSAHAKENRFRDVVVPISVRLVDCSSQTIIPKSDDADPKIFEIEYSRTIGSRDQLYGGELFLITQNLFDVAFSEKCNVTSYQFVQNDQGDPIGGELTDFVDSSSFSTFLEAPAKKIVYNFWVELTTVQGLKGYCPVRINL